MTFPNKLPVLLAAVTALAASSVTFGQTSSAEIWAGTIQLSTVHNYAGPDGEFTAYGIPTPSGYNTSALYQGVGPLETFCVEDSTYFWQSNVFGTSYAYSVSGDVQVPTPYASLGNQSVPYTPVALNAGVAWLYSEFATGSFTGSLVVNSDGNAAALQEAIWELQGGLADPAHPTVIGSNPYVVAANAGVSSASSAARASNFDVEVLNLYLWGGNIGQANSGSWGAGGGDNVASSIYQNQLIYVGPTTPPQYVPVPDGGTTIALFGVALIGLGLGVSRRRLVTAS